MRETPTKILERERAIEVFKNIRGLAIWEYPWR